MLILAAAVAVAGVVSDAPPPVPAGAVMPAILTPGTVTIRSGSSATVPADTHQQFDDAVRRAMLRAGFTPLPGQDHGRYIATVTVTRTSRGVVASDRPAGPPPLASLNGSVSLSLPPGGDRLSDLVVTTLRVTIARRDDAAVSWSGNAVTARVAGTRAGAVDLVARTLADATLAQFPTGVDATVSVP